MNKNQYIYKAIIFPVYFTYLNMVEPPRIVSYVEKDTFVVEQENILDEEWWQQVIKRLKKNSRSHHSHE
jgi:hypothetical protein